MSNTLELINKEIKELLNACVRLSKILGENQSQLTDLPPYISNMCNLSSSLLLMHFLFEENHQLQRVLKKDEKPEKTFLH